MTVESFDPQSADIDGPAADEVRGFLSQYKYPLLILGGLVVVAAMLGSVARRRGVLPGVGVDRTAPGPLERTVQFSADWEASLRHFAQAVDQRMAGFQQQLDAMHAALGTDGPLSAPTATLNGAANQTYEAATAEQPENIPPGPAAVSQ